MNNKVRLNRLTKLHYILDNHKEVFPEVKFDISTWSEPYECGTAACALGSACCYKPFKKSGLYLDPSFFNDVPRYKHYTELNAGQEFFGLSCYEAEWLFMPRNYDIVDTKVTAKMVARRVLFLIKHYECSGGKAFDDDEGKLRTTKFYMKGLRA